MNSVGVLSAARLHPLICEAIRKKLLFLLWHIQYFLLNYVKLSSKNFSHKILNFKYTDST
jgi:hypothetical protein